MIPLDEYKMSLGGFEEQLEECRKALSPESIKEEIQALDDQMSAPDFWNDVETANKLTQRSRQLQNKLERYNKLKSRFDDLGALIEMAEDESLRNFEVTLRNDTDSVAFFVRASLSLEPGGLEILPITYSDNYVTLFPGETRVLTAQIAASDLDGVDPVLEVEGHNVPRQEIA